MRLLIVSTAPFIYKDSFVYAYSPYVQELVVWNRFADEIAFCCPIWKHEKNLLIHPIPFKIDKHFMIRDVNLSSALNIFYAFLYGFHSVFMLFKAMVWADHIHLRCPGNVGLLGSLVQVLFPNKIKTAKYAGNWDPQSKQPWSYKLQKWILGSPFFTRNMQVLVYGVWEGTTKNIKPFFTATYKEEDKTPIVLKSLKNKIHFLFVGALVSGKNPLYAIQLVVNLSKKGYDVMLDLYGDGEERLGLEQYIEKFKLEQFISIKGNQTPETVKNAYKGSHFIILPSDSEGWPKAIAEGMFWGCVPISTSVSCIPFMLNYGNNGLLLVMHIEDDLPQLEALLQNELDYKSKQQSASDWSRKYTIDGFESEIRDLLK